MVQEKRQEMTREITQEERVFLLHNPLHGRFMKH